MRSVSLNSSVSSVLKSRPNVEAAVAPFISVSIFLYGHNSFIDLLRQNGIETADQFVDSFCVEYEGVVESDEFVVIVFEGNSYFFRRLCGLFR